MSVFSVILGLKNSSFVSGINEARSSLANFKKEIGQDLAGGISIAALGATAMHLVEVGDSFADMSQRFGVGAESLQRWGQVAESNGASVEEMAAGLNKLIINQDKALAGDEELRKHFEALGVSIEDLQSLSPDQLMMKLGQSSMNAADMVGVLGKNALALAPSLQAAAEGALEFTSAMDQDTIDKLGEISDKLKELKARATVLGGGALVNILKGVGTPGAIFGGAAVGLQNDGFRGMVEGAKTAFNEIWGRGGAQDEMQRRAREMASQEDQKEAQRRLDEAKKLDEQLAELVAKRHERERTDEQNLFFLQQRRNRLKSEIDATPVSGLDSAATKNKQIELEQVRAQIRDYETKIVAKRTQDAKERESKEAAIKKLREEASEILREDAFKRMSAGQQILDLEKRIADERKKAIADPKAKAESAKRIAEMTAQRNDIAAGLADRMRDLVERAQSARKSARDNIANAREARDEAIKREQTNKDGETLDKMTALERLTPGQRRRLQRAEERDRKAQEKAEKAAEDKFVKQFGKERLQAVKDARDPVKQAETAFNKALKDTNEKLDEQITTLGAIKEKLGWPAR